METLHAWAAILAGGDGARLRAFTRTFAGDDRPKQFCRLLGSDSLTATTAQRIDTLVAPHRTLYVVTEAHRRFYEDALGHISPRLLLEQPVNRGTAVAIAWSVVKTREYDPAGILGIFPSDHHYENPAAFRAALAMAYAAAEMDSDRIFLLGSEADQPEADYGWIEPGDALYPPTRVGRHAPRAVRSFIEKPPPPVALVLMDRRCLWNTFVMIGHVRAFERLIDEACPGLLQQVELAVSEPDAVTRRDLFACLPTADFSSDVLAPHSDYLGVVALAHAGWTDLGRPSRVLRAMASRGRLPVHGRAAG